jgi:hypothetical protein
MVPTDESCVSHLRKQEHPVGIVLLRRFDSCEGRPICWSGDLRSSHISKLCRQLREIWSGIGSQLRTANQVVIGQSILVMDFMEDSSSASPPGEALEERAIHTSTVPMSNPGEPIFYVGAQDCIIGRTAGGITDRS